MTHSVANHLNTEMAVEFCSLNFSNAGFWFSERLGFEVKLPDLKRLGLNFLGGRKCSLGKISAACLFCNLDGKRASLFLINPEDVKFDIAGNRKYVVEGNGATVTIWKEAGVICALAVYGRCQKYVPFSITLVQKPIKRMRESLITKR